jgi:hypothetical protein
MVEDAMKSDAAIRVEAGVKDCRQARFDDVTKDTGDVRIEKQTLEMNTHSCRVISVRRSQHVSQQLLHCGRHRPILRMRCGRVCHA